jgi:tryptophan-rich sensory protein
MQLFYFSKVPVLKQKNREGFAQTLYYLLIITFGIGIIWMILVFALPTYAPRIAGIGAIMSLLLILIFSVLSTE